MNAAFDGYNARFKLYRYANSGFPFYETSKIFVASMAVQPRHVKTWWFRNHYGSDARMTSSASDDCRRIHLAASYLNDLLNRFEFKQGLSGLAFSYLFPFRI